MIILNTVLGRAISSTIVAKDDIQGIAERQPLLRAIALPGVVVGASLSDGLGRKRLMMT